MTITTEPLASDGPAPTAPSPRPIATNSLPVPADRLTRARQGAAAASAGQRARQAALTLLSRSDGDPDALALGWLVVGGSPVAAQWLVDNVDVAPDTAASAITEVATVLGRGARLSAAEAIALRLRQHGIARLFAYPGTSELSLCQAMGAFDDGTLTNARGDTEAVFMAGGASLAGHLCAAALLHGARGLTNAAGAVADLRRNEVPALIIVGLPGTRSARFLPPHAEPGIITTIGDFAKAATETSPQLGSSGAGDIVDHVDTSVMAATSAPWGPAILGVPQDVLEARSVPLGALTRPLPGPSPTEPAAADVAAGSDLVRAAERPVILVDDYLLQHPGATDAVAAFADAADAVVLQARYRRGPMLFERLDAARVPRFAGWYDPARPDHRHLVHEADLLVTVEDRNLYARVVGQLPDCRKLALTSDASKAWKNGYLDARDLVIEASPVATMRHLTANLVGRPGHGTRDESLRTLGPPAPRAEAKEPVTSSPVAVPLARVVAACLRYIGADTVIDDSQMLGGLLSNAYDTAFRHTQVRGGHAGFVGAGLPTAAGLAITSQRPVLCLLGDQGLTNGFQGLVAAAQERAPVLYLVCNNQESVSLRKQALELGFGAATGDFDRLLRNPPRFDYVHAATGVGVAATKIPVDVGNISELVERVTGAVASLWSVGGGPALIELVLPPLGPAWDGVWATRGHDETDRATPPDPTVRALATPCSSTRSGA